MLTVEREPSLTRRLVNSGAESLLYAPTPILDKGYISLVDYMGCDETVVAAARHSYDKGLDLNDHAGNEKLINFLMKGRHTSPFEQPAMVFEVKAPIFVFREWHRHRTPKLNEMSARYTVLPNEFYIPSPERIQAQSKSNKQGSGAQMDEKFVWAWTTAYKHQMNQVFVAYEDAAAAGLAKEVARVSLPVATYSKMVWQCDLHNLLHFLGLRMAPTAQWEIRQYANEIGRQVSISFPKIWAAWEEHMFYAKTFSRSELTQLRRILEGFMEDLGGRVFPEKTIAAKLGLLNV